MSKSAGSFDYGHRLREKGVNGRKSSASVPVAFLI